MTILGLSAIAIPRQLLRSLESSEDGPKLQLLVSKCSLFIGRGGLQRNGIFSSWAVLMWPAGAGSDKSQFYRMNEIYCNTSQTWAGIRIAGVVCWNTICWFLPPSVCVSRWAGGTHTQEGTFLTSSLLCWWLENHCSVVMCGIYRQESSYMAADWNKGMHWYVPKIWWFYCACQINFQSKCYFLNKENCIK